jgi:hypothetical protein
MPNANSTTEPYADIQDESEAVTLRDPSPITRALLAALESDTSPVSVQS